MESIHGFQFHHCYSDDNHSTTAPPPPSNIIGTPSLIPLSASSSSDHALLSTNNVLLQQLHDDEEHDHHLSHKVLRAKVASHPLFPQLLHNYIDCHKVGAPPEMAQLLDEIIRKENRNNIGVHHQIPAFFGADLELDDFMETYCNLLGKYKYELARPFEEATMFLNDMETQLNSLIHCNNDPTLLVDEVRGSSEKGFMKDDKEGNEWKRINEDKELKDNLLRRYSGYISSLKNEFSKNKKKERLPNEAKQILLAWWNIHFKWPYPTDADKVALAEWTGLDQKQINNWFINQRKRHWKLPSEHEMHAALLDGHGIYDPICISESE